jgi:hypothetical protein
MTSAANVVVAVVGAVYVAEYGTPAPSRASDPLGSAWSHLGYISESGVKEEHDMESDQITAWQGSRNVRTTILKYAVKYSLEAVETNRTVMDLVYGTGTPGSGATYSNVYEALYTPTYGEAAGAVALFAGAEPMSRQIIGSNPDQQYVALIVDVVDGAQAIRRYCPRAALNASGETVMNGSEAVLYPMEFQAMPDSTLGGSVLAMYNYIR